MPSSGVTRLILLADLCGTFVFAMEGALAAIHARLDVLGVMVLAFTTALCGGIVRDLMLGAAPPMAVRDWRYPVIAFVAGSIAFVFYGFVRQAPRELLVTLDAAGLGLFAMAGTEKALTYRISPFIAALLGTMTAVGGGTIRDVLLATVPAVLRVDVYATAALAGSLLMVAGRAVGVRAEVAAVAGGVLCFALRMMAFWLHWNLPVIARP